MKNPQALLKQDSSRFNRTCGDAGDKRATRRPRRENVRQPPAAGSKNPDGPAPDAADEVILLGLKA
jgi:hypothetical protein